MSEDFNVDLLREEHHGKTLDKIHELAIEEIQYLRAQVDAAEEAISELQSELDRLQRELADARGEEEEEEPFPETRRLGGPGEPDILPYPRQCKYILPKDDCYE